MLASDLPGTGYAYRFHREEAKSAVIIAWKQSLELGFAFRFLIRKRKHANRFEIKPGRGILIWVFETEWIIEYYKETDISEIRIFSLL